MPLNNKEFLLKEFISLFLEQPGRTPKPRSDTILDRPDVDEQTFTSMKKWVADRMERGQILQAVEKGYEGGIDNFIVDYGFGGINPEKSSVATQDNDKTQISSPVVKQEPKKEEPPIPSLEDLLRKSVEKFKKPNLPPYKGPDAPKRSTKTPDVLKPNKPVTPRAKKEAPIKAPKASSKQVPPSAPIKEPLISVSSDALKAQLVDKFPHITSEQLASMKKWVAGSMKVNPENYSKNQIVRTIGTEYKGGISGFLRDKSSDWE